MCASPSSAIPKPALGDLSSGSSECAAAPASSARARSVSNRDSASARADRRPYATKREGLTRSHLDAALDGERRPVVEGMGELNRRLDPVDLEPEPSEGRRDDRERMDRRADVVAEARDRQLLGARAAADGALLLVDHDLEPGAGEHARGGEPVGPGADDDRLPQIRFGLVPE
jgi:hypothetical protein